MSELGKQQLPPGWVHAELGEIGYLLCGQSPPSESVNIEGIGIPYISGPEHWDGSTVKLDKWTTEPKRMVPDGGIFITVKGAGVGIVFPGVSAAIGRDIYAFFPEKTVSQNFVTHALRFTTSEIVRQAKGDIPGLSKDHILLHQILVPPVREQARIADTLEELFSDLDSGVEALKRAREKLKLYRASVLKAAVEGVLSAEWRQQHPHTEPASELLKRILVERRHRWEEDQLAKFKAKDQQPPKNWKTKYKEPVSPDTATLSSLPEGWCWASLDQISSIVGGVTKGQKFSANAPAREISYLRVANVQRGFLDLNEIKKIIALESDIELLRLQPGDVLFNEGGDRDKLGRGWIWQEELDECIHQNHVFRARLIGKEIQPKLVSWSGNSYGQQWFMREGKQSVNLASINLTILRSFPLPIAPPGEQEAIVEAVEDQLSVIDHLEAELDAKLKETQNLRQAILRQAFTGKLVPQDPNDEPASELLQRIAAERAARASEAKPKPKKPSGRKKA